MVVMMSAYGFLTDHTNFYYCRYEREGLQNRKGLTDHTNFYYCRCEFCLKCILASLTDHTNFYYCRL